MYYSRNVREQKVKELEGNKEFTEYAQKEFEIYKKVDGFGGYNTFEEYLVGNVFDLYENFTMLEFIKTADKKTIARALDRAFEDEFEAMEQTLEEQKNSPEIWALRGEISNLRHELDGALIYDPDYAPKIEKCLAIRELELNAALEGVKLNLDPDDIIDADHLDCFWYDGYIGSIEYKGYVVDVKAAGDVRFSVLDEKHEFLADFNNPAHEDILPYIKDDETLHKFIEDGRVVFSLQNWVEYVVHDKNDNVIDSEPFSAVLGNNVLEAFADVSVYKDVIEKIALANDKEVVRNGVHSTLADNIAAAEQVKKIIPKDGMANKDIIR